MDRRVFGCLLGGVHLVLATGLVGVVVTVFWWILLLLLDSRFPGLDAYLAGAISFVVPVLLAVLVLTLWWLAAAMFAMSLVQRSMVDAQEGRFAQASERLRRMRDLEPFLRLAGMGGGSFARLRVAEAYAYALHGLSDEATRMALEDAHSRLRPALARAAAAIAAIGAVETGDAAAWSELGPHLAWAERNATDPNAQAMLASRGQWRALALDFAGAELDAAHLERARPGSRTPAALRGLLAGLRGRWDDAERELLAAERSPLLGTANSPAANHPLTAMRIENARDRGRPGEALALAETLAKERPAHRVARLAIASVRGELGDSAARQAALAELDAITAHWSFSPPVLAGVALARARIARASGRPADGLAGLGPALASVQPAVRQRALLEAGECALAHGDAAAARAHFEEAVRLSADTFAGAAAAARLV